MKNKQTLKGTMVVEMACLGAFFVLAMTTAVFLFFYYYDKAILQGAVFETAVFGAERYEEGKEQMLETYFQDRVREKTIFFSGADVKISCDKEVLTVQAQMQQGELKVSVRASSIITRPEDKMREKRKWTGYLGEERTDGDRLYKRCQ